MRSRTSPTSSHLTGYTFGVTTKADTQFKTWAEWSTTPRPIRARSPTRRPAPAPRCTSAWSRSPAKAGIKLTHVPFKGGAETNAAVLGGHTTLQADFDAAGSRWSTAGQLRLLVIWTAERSKNWPDAPTLQGARLPLRVRFALRRRRAEGHGPEPWCRSCTMPSRRRSRTRR